MMRTLTKKYSAKFPETPKSVDEIIAYFTNPVIVATSGQTLRDKGEPTTQFFKHAYESDDFAVCMFASDDVISINETISVDRRLFFADGIFKICPYGKFDQLLVLSTDVSSQVIVYHSNMIA